MSRMPATHDVRYLLMFRVPACFLCLKGLFDISFGSVAPSQMTESSSKVLDLWSEVSITDGMLTRSLPQSFDARQKWAACSEVIGRIHNQGAASLLCYAAFCVKAL